MIIDLYNTLIICDNYSVKIGESVDIRIRCIGYDNQPVVAENIKLYYDTNTEIYTGVTNNGGECHTSYTFNDYGLHTLTVNNVMVQINVEREMYPVGSIYTSIDGTNPSTLFGGVWERIQGRFLFACEDNGGDNYSTSNKTGGSKNAVLVSHNHGVNHHTHSPASGRNFLTAPVGSTWVELAGANISGSGFHYIATSKTSNYDVYVDGSGIMSPHDTTWKGEDGTNKNMPPYLTVYMWRRIE